MTTRYDIRPECEVTWTVYDQMTDAPAQIEGVETVGLNMQDADELAEVLNRQAEEKYLATA